MIILENNEYYILMNKNLTFCASTTGVVHWIQYRYTTVVMLKKFVYSICPERKYGV